MKTRVYSLFVCLAFSLLFSFSACAQLKITASVTVTNKTTNGMTFTYNGDTRTFTNNVVNPATQVATNADVTGCGSKTNFLTQIQLNPFAQTKATSTGSNTFDIVGNADLPVTLSVSAGYASVSYSTQLVTDMVLVQVPVSGLPTAPARTNVASGIVGAINAAENTNVISSASLAAQQLVGTNNTQTISGQKTFSNPLSIWNGAVVQSANSGNVLRGTYESNSVLENSVFTNAVNYGNAFSSPGSGSFSEQFGNGAVASGTGSYAAGPDGPIASGNVSIAIGDDAFATADASMAVGSHATSTGASGAAFGAGALASGGRSTAIGTFANATATNSTALGYQASATFPNSTAIGVNASNTTSNQTMIGSSGVSTVIQNNLTVQTNLEVNGNVTLHGLTTNQTWIGTNNYGADADIAFVRKAVSTLANGGNAAVPVGTNVFFEVSGPSGSFSIDGIANGRDGKLVYLLNQTGFQMTIKNESGTDPTAANRIRTLGSATDLVLTNAAVTLIYNGSVSRWMVISHNP